MGPARDPAGSAGRLTASIDRAHRGMLSIWVCLRQLLYTLVYTLMHQHLCLFNLRGIPIILEKGSKYFWLLHVHGVDPAQKLPAWRDPFATPFLVNDSLYHGGSHTMALLLVCKGPTSHYTALAIAVRALQHLS